ncbi:MAG: glucosamine-6-phosphate isomerase, partial [Clostridia bacterium]|nr:glucosamine-6-phosphate isomerase [Clostridia bacterium]
MNFNSTVKGSLCEDFFPKGWDLDKMDECCSHAPETIGERQKFWNKDFAPIECADVKEFDVKMGHEIANEIRKANAENRKIAFILPVGPMGMYKWAVYFLKEWNVSCQNVWCFNMDEWADAEGNTITGDASFQNAMEQAFYNPLGDKTVPVSHRNFATKNNLPTYPEKIAALKKEGAKLVLVYGIGRMCHIAFWEPTIGAEFDSDEKWMEQPYRVAVKLHPLTIEQN